MHGDWMPDEPGGKVAYMRVVATSEHRFDGTPDGAIWTLGAFSYSFWRRYLSVFDHVRVVARVRKVAQPFPDWQRADGDAVSFLPVPYYLGPWQYLLRRRQVHTAVRQGIREGEAVILRVPSQIAGAVEPVLRRTGRPYGLVVVVDPYDAYAAKSVQVPFRPLVRWWMARRLRRRCASASAVAYVTKEALQRRYPPPPGAFTTSFSDVELPHSAFVPRPRKPDPAKDSFTLVTVCSLAYLTKGPDVLIDALATCVQQGLDLRLVLVGEGRYRAAMQARAISLGIGERVRFTGQLPSGAPVREQLDQADLFVLPSRAEGLPRSMIEAMARGLPCIGCTVGGVPELLPPEDLVAPNDVRGLALRILQVLGDPERMALMSERNLAAAREYREDVQSPRRDAFCRYVLQRTEAWQSKRAPE